MNEQESQLRKACNLQGGVLLIYRVILNVVVVLFSVAAAVIVAVKSTMALLGQEDVLPEEILILELTDSITAAVTQSSGWGYLLAVAVGLLILLLWKKPAWFRAQLTQRGKPMQASHLAVILIVTVAIQLVIQLLVTAVEALLNRFGLSLTGLMESASASTNDVGMLLYIGIAAPITEELLFRGLVMRSVQPFGKGFALWFSAVLFALFHASPIQTPFALLMGLLLGYVAMEYHILWAMAVHFFNNMILGDTLPRLLSLLPYELPDAAMWLIYLACGIAAAVIAGK